MSTYLFDESSVSSTMSSMKSDIEVYRESVTELKKLITTIESSDAWVDNTVKTSFVSTANSYVEKYEEVIKWMEALVDYLSEKSSAATALENAYK
jgi:hypothetical protein